MRPVNRPIAILLGVVGLVILFILVTSISSLAISANQQPAAAGNPQVLTPTPTAEDGSVAGSTDGIVWMGITITLIVILPIIAHRAMWVRQQSQ